jgi:hypothetical protein
MIVKMVGHNVEAVQEQVRKNNIQENTHQNHLSLLQNDQRGFIF